MKRKSLTRLVIADDHYLFRAGLRSIFTSEQLSNYNIIGEAENGYELIEKVKSAKPDIVLTDILMPEMDGVTACRHIKQHYPGVKIIALSAMDQLTYISNMVTAGATGYLVKQTTVGEIKEAIDSVNAGSPYYCTNISESIFGTPDNAKFRQRSQIRLSTQETRVMQLICKQYSTKEIAGIMSLAVRTIEDHRQHLLEKIGAKNVVGIALYALMQGIVNTRDLQEGFA